MMVSRHQSMVGCVKDGQRGDCAEAGIDCDSRITAVSKWSCVVEKREREGLDCFTDFQS